MGWGERQGERQRNKQLRALGDVIRERNLAWGANELHEREIRALRSQIANQITDHQAEINQLDIKLAQAQGMANRRGRIIEQIRDHFGLSDAELQAILDCKDEHHS